MISAELSIAPITPSIGAEVRGVDLRRPLDDATFAALRDAVDDHHVVVVRDQFLDAAEQHRLAERFGPLLAAPVQRIQGVAPTVSTIEDNARRPPAGFGWHTDLSWVDEPPAFGFLSAVTIPATGGDTVWVSTAALYARLSPAERRWCDEARAVHAADEQLRRTVERHHGAELAARLLSEYPPVDHPLVRAHARSGRPSLFLSPLYVRRVVGPSGRPDGAFLARLHERLEDVALQLRWRWREGDVVIWDETSTVHRALTDHYPQRRVMRRCVTGERYPIVKPR